MDESKLDAIAIRCWTELQKLNISPCVLLGEMNNRRVSSACEVDIGNAVMMHALTWLPTPPRPLDWNNNYADEEDNCILFHCGPCPS